MTDLHARLVAALQARLEVARAATPGPWAIWRDLDHQGFYTVGDEAGVIPEGQQETEDECNPTAHVYVEWDAKFIAANDPATEIRRVEAKLRVVEAYEAALATAEVAEGTVLAGAAKLRVATYEAVIRDLAAGEGIEP